MCKLKWCYYCAGRNPKWFLEDEHMCNHVCFARNPQELQTKLQQEIDQSQHELSALQDAHHQKLSNLNRKHKSEIESYKEKIEELEEDLDLNTDESSASKHGDESKLKEKLSLVQNKLERTKEELEETETSNASLQSEIEKLKLKDRQSSKQRTDFEGIIVQLRKEKEILNKEKEKLEQVSKDQTRALEKTKMEVRGSDDTTQKELEELRRLLEGMFVLLLFYRACLFGPQWSLS